MPKKGSAKKASKPNSSEVPVRSPSPEEVPVRSPGPESRPVVLPETSTTPPPPVLRAVSTATPPVLPNPLAVTISSPLLSSKKELVRARRMAGNKRRRETAEAAKKS